MAHEISMTTAGEIDNDWINAGMPDDGLRIYGLRRSGNRTMTFLADPGNDSAPRYVLSNGRYLHVSGPTLDEWEMQAEYRDAAETTAGLLQFQEVMMNHVADISGPNDSTIQIYEDTSGTRGRWHYEVWIDMFSDLASIPIDTHEELLPQALEEIAGAIVRAYSYGMDTGSTNAKYSIRRALGIS